MSDRRITSAYYVQIVYSTLEWSSSLDLFKKKLFEKYHRSLGENWSTS